MPIRDSPAWGTEGQARSLAIGIPSLPDLFLLNPPVTEQEMLKISCYTR